MGKENLELELYENCVMGKDPKVIVEYETGIHFIDAPYFHTYHGKVVGKDGSRVAITTYDDLFIGMIDIDDNPYYIELTKEKTATLSSRSTTRIDILPCYDRGFKDIYGSYTAAEGEI